jgi:hypothetical protein
MKLLSIPIVRNNILVLLLGAHAIQRLLLRVRMGAALLLRAAFNGPRSQRPMVLTRAAASAESSLAAATARLAAGASQPAGPVSNKHAACLVPLYEDGAGTVRVWLTRRSKTLRTHAGAQCALRLRSERSRSERRARPPGRAGSPPGCRPSCGTAPLRGRARSG